MGGAAMPAKRAGSGFEASRVAQYQGRTTPAVIFVALIAASGGLLFGFDNGITGGVIAQKSFQELFFPSMLEPHPENAGDAFCKFDDHMLQLFTSCLFLAGAVAAMFGSYTCKRFGRKSTMVMGGLCFLAGTGLVAGAVHVAMLVIGRIVLGFGVGFATQATPLYLSEMAPFNIRGALNIMFQLAVTIGILAAQLINYGTQHIPSYGWRISLAAGAVPALMLSIGALMLSDTPNSLVQRGRSEDARKVLQRIRGTDSVDVEFEDIQEAVRIDQSIKTNPYRTICQRRYWPQLVITVLIPMFQQLTGINAIMFYAPQLFESVGHDAEGALLSTVITGAVNVASTVVAILVVDRLGRKFLFLQGGSQMFICEVLVGILIALNVTNPSESMAAGIIALICIYVAGFAWSWGPLGWLVPSEIQPLETRAAGTGINTTVNFLFTFIIGQCFLSMLCAMKFGTFWFFAGFVFIMTMFVLFFVPETKGVPIEELNELIVHKHWFWRKVVAGTPVPEAELAFPSPLKPAVGANAV